MEKHFLFECISKSNLHKYVDQTGSTAMLTAKWPAGVAPQVILTNPLDTVKKAYKREIPRSPKQWYQYPLPILKKKPKLRVVLMIQFFQIASILHKQFVSVHYSSYIHSHTLRYN